MTSPPCSTADPGRRKHRPGRCQRWDRQSCWASEWSIRTKKHLNGSSQSWQEDLPDADFKDLATHGWRPDFNDRANFLEAVHVQAYYLQVRFFPRLQWFSLHAPKGEFFIIGDRAVGWIADGYVNAPPSWLRSPSAYVLAPLTKTLVLVGRHTTDPWQVTPWQVNQQVAALAHEWIAGPTRQCIDAALVARKAAFEPPPG